ncbi:unnamed protein product [Rotaria sp. Silwood2]|nr:unnamed protein product [Rotaria sp. Silwood2]CAF2467871.1 unnamed protein product [Rotaria sp. Silwood2]CAF2709346.1 unnamed protein product [Rotaria sp. Silwood2]CAF2860452.1 unnamed protein product [Rotaria sp. Silwood2]CAF3917944.1 unnamed protein product [Rotaria sp. Silwood2]
MDQIDNKSNTDIRQHALCDMMKQYISSDLSFQYSANYSDQFLQQNNNEDISIVQSSNIEHEQNENEQLSMPMIYRKRIRTKFSPEQLNVLESTFQKHRYPTVDIVDELVEQLNLPTQKITIWFQNRRARLKKSQQKFDDQYSFDKDNQQQYDSGIHLDDEVSHDSSTSSPANSLIQLPPVPPPPPPFITPHASYYLPHPHYSFYNPMWSNFRYPCPTPSFQPTTVDATNIPYNLMSYHSPEISSPFVFQNMSNYQHQREFNDEL